VGCGGGEVGWAGGEVGWDGGAEVFVGRAGGLITIEVACRPGIGVRGVAVSIKKRNGVDVAVFVGVMVSVSVRVGVLVTVGVGPVAVGKGP